MFLQNTIFGDETMKTIITANTQTKAHAYDLLDALIESIKSDWNNDGDYNLKHARLVEKITGQKIEDILS
jgi:hypothetical protein